MTLTIKIKGVFDPNSVVGAAGWGATMWTPPHGYFHASGSIDMRIRGSTEAELVALHNGILAAMNLGIAPMRGKVEVQTDCRELVAVLLHLMPAAQCLGKYRMERALTVRRDLRESATMERLIDKVRLNGFQMVFLIMKADALALEAARAGMNLVRARAI